MTYPPSPFPNPQNPGAGGKGRWEVGEWRIYER